MTIVEIDQIASLVAHIVSIVGVPVGICVYLNEKRKERLDREYGTYNALDDKYVEYLTHCMNNPELDLYYVPLADGPHRLTATQEIQQLALFEILLTQMERSYLMYSGHASGIRAEQWEGWDAYIDTWVARESFAKLLNKVEGNQFDTKFFNYLTNRISTRAKS